MTVGQFLSAKDLTLDHVGQKAATSIYWQGCYLFVKDVLHRDIATLSPKQYAWLERIAASLLDKS